MKSRANAIVGAAVVAVLAIAVAAFVFLQGGAGAGEAPGQLRAVVHDGDGGVHELSLSKDEELVVTTSLGTNVVVVEAGDVYVREADCSNQDCVHQGRLSGPGRQIICLPHKLWIEVVADGDSGASDMDVGAVAGSSADGSADGKTDDYDVVTR